eukprot:UN30500
MLSLATCYASENNLEKLWLELKAHKIEYHNVQFYNHMIIIYAKLGKLEQALKIFKIMVVDPTISENEITREALLQVFRKKGLWKESLQFIREWEAKKAKINLKSYSIMLSMLADAGQTKLLEKLYYETNKKFGKHHTRDTTLMNCYANANDVEKVFELYNKTQPDIAKFSIVIKALSSTKQTERLVRFYLENPQLWNWTTLNLIMNYLYEADDLINLDFVFLTSYQKGIGEYRSTDR